MNDSQKRQKRTILLVGGSGYIGGAITPHLLGAGYTVRNLDLNIYGNYIVPLSYIGHPNYEFRYGDFTDEQSFGSALNGVSDVVFLAGLVGDPITAKYPVAAATINGVGVRAAIDQLHSSGIGRLVFISTCSNYGYIEGDHFATESSPLSPLSAYASEKVAAEKHLLAKRDKVDYVPTILRFATAFGNSSRMRFDLTVNEFTRLLHMREELFVYDARTWRPYCHVVDFYRVIRQVLESPDEQVYFEVFNAGGAKNNATKQMIVDYVTEQLPGRDVKYKQNSGNPRNYRVDFSKIEERLNFVPNMDIQAGVSEIIAAHDAGYFNTVSENPNLYGNYVIQSDRYSNMEL